MPPGLPKKFKKKKNEAVRRGKEKVYMRHPVSLEA